MERSKKVVFLSHCILNQNTVVQPLARAKGAYRDIIQKFMESGIGIHQMPCPEFRYLGLARNPMTKEEYDTDNFRKTNAIFAKDTIKTIQEYLINDYKIVGIVGINESPTCGIRGNMGIFMEELLCLLKKENIVLNFIDVPTNYHDDDKSNNFIEELDSWINEI